MSKTKTDSSVPKSQIKSRERVAKRGEVFTAEREVKAMCDLVKDETERIDSRFLEPACGDGNFLAEILERKLAAVTRTYAKNPNDWEKYSVVAVSSVYGVDIMADNAAVCRNRLFEIWQEKYEKHCKKLPVEQKEETKKSVRFILERNILLGNALSLKEVDENQNDKASPIIFSEWSLIGTKLKRRDFIFNDLVNKNYGTNLVSDSGNQAEIFSPVQDYPLVHYRKAGENK
jgi:hypothetical protein